MKKMLINIFKILPENAVALITFYIIFNIFRSKFPEYAAYATIPLALIVVFLVIENRKEWKILSLQR